MSTVLAALLLFGFRSTAVATTSTTPFELLEDGSIVVAVTIGGTGPYRFVLDTGSSRTIISTRLWKTLRLPVVAKTVVVTPAGRDEAYIVRLGDFAVDGHPGVSVSAAVLPADRYAAGQQVDGMIGQDVLATAVYTIDYGRRAVRWHGPDDTLPGVRLPLNIRDNRLLVSLPQYAGDRSPIDLIPDSGTDGLVVFARSQDKLRLTPIDAGRLVSVAGSRPVRRVRVEDLVVGAARLQNALAVVIDNDEPAATMGDGLLPLHLFARVTLNVAERYLIVHPR